MNGASFMRDGCAMCVIWGYGREEKKTQAIQPKISWEKKTYEITNILYRRRHDRIKCWLFNKFFLTSMSLFTLYYYKFVDSNSSILGHKKMKIGFSINWEILKYVMEWLLDDDSCEITLIVCIYL